MMRSWLGLIVVGACLVGCATTRNVDACEAAGEAAEVAFADCDRPPNPGPTCQEAYGDVGDCDYTAYFECVEAAANAADLGDCTDADALSSTRAGSPIATRTRR